MTGSELGTIVFSEPKASGNFKKIGISDPNGKKVLIEMEECFSWGIQRNDRQGRIQTVATVAYATVRFFKDNFF